MRLQGAGAQPAEDYTTAVCTPLSGDLEAVDAAVKATGTDWGQAQIE